MRNCISTPNFLPITPISFCMYTNHLIYSSLLHLLNLINGLKHQTKGFSITDYYIFYNYLITPRILGPKQLSLI